MYSRGICFKNYEGEDVMSKAITQQENLKTKSKKTKNGSLQRSRMWQLYSLGAIPLLVVLITKYLPMFGIIVGFKKYRYDKGILGSEWVGFKNFEFFFKSSDFTRITRNTLVMNGIFIIVGLIAAVGLALLMYELTSRLKTKVYMTILITPHFLSWVIVSYIAYAFLDPSYGVFNTFLAKFGVEKIQWYSEAGYWPWILTFFYLWKHTGMNSIIYYASLMGIDSSLIEAAEIDGATNWQCKRYVVIPCLLPLIVIMTIMNIGSIFHSDFGLFYQVTRNVGKLYATTDVIDTYVFRTLRVIGDMGTGTAVGLIQSVIGMILVLTTNWLRKKFDSEYGLL